MPNRNEQVAPAAHKKSRLIKQKQNQLSATVKKNVGEVNNDKQRRCDFRL